MTSGRRAFSIAIAIAAALSLAALLAAGAARAQPAEIPNAAELTLALRKLGVLGSALYVAAHPDDENTAMLAYLARERLVRTAYLSMTRGDGGQNLIGTEKSELLGLLRTQELLAARKIDRAEQFFTRALDFGYSKSPEETLALWGRDEILADTVRVIRTFRPDLIVDRFPVTGEGGHGHHTASAILAEEAFAAAADPRRFPEQLADLKPWQAKRLVWNRFRFGADAPRTPQPGDLSVDLGAYNALLGKAYTEIAALSRSMHKSQGFGSAERRGSFSNDFQPRLGAPATSDLFDGVELTWKRIDGGEEVARLVAQANREFDPRRPAAIVPILIRAYAAMRALGDDPLVVAKREETLELIRDCAGLWLEAIAKEPSATPGGKVEVAAVALNRSALPLTLESVEASYQETAPATPAAPLADNQPVTRELRLALPADVAYTNPYWLVEPAEKGRFRVRDARLVGRPQAPPPLAVSFTITLGGERLRFETPVLYRFTDPVKGEQYRTFEIAPPVTFDLDEKVYLFAGDGAPAAPRELRVRARAGRAGVAGALRLELASGWQAAPASQRFAMKENGEEAELRFTVTPPAAPGVGRLAATVRFESGAGPGPEEVARGATRVDYPHIPVQTLFAPAEAKLVRVELERRGERIGYVMGSGDEVPDALRQLGYSVSLLSDTELADADLGRFDAVVVGVRAFNTRPRLAAAHARLMAYVERGGTLVVQYSTADRALGAIGPYPFALSRDRVTVEEAPVTFVNPAHPLLQTPNRIVPADFDGWVQERGLYFASEKEGERWDARYETVLASHDPGESEKSGGLLYARHGAGVFVYTGYAFFRQLPAGVPGAVRLFVNLVSARGADAPAR